MAEYKNVFTPSKKPHFDDNDPGLLRRLASGRRLTLEDLDKSGAVVLVGGRIVGKQMFLRIMAEMRQYKTIEKEMNIDLDTLFKALKNGCFVKEKFDYMGRELTQIIFTKFTYFYYADDIGDYLVHIRTRDYYLKDYGKTWALTKEELS